uniref:CheR-type methyltransferase domain-containing protein n=1 Tax=Anaerolinea thermolimosa TaxID=229919 RepID=A0A7C4KIV6_9CHLR
MIDAVTTNKTDFFREPDHFETLTKRLIPTILERNPGRRHLSFWSAGCATGEEPLTLALLLNETGWFERATIQIVGSDVSPRAISLAQQGVYRERSFRSLPAHLRAKYFELQDGRWRIDPALHQRVTWMRVNLMDEARRKGLEIDTRSLSRDLGVPAVPIVARTGEGMQTLLSTMEEVITGQIITHPRRVQGPPEFQQAVETLARKVETLVPGLPNPRWIAIRLLDGDARIQQALVSGELAELMHAQQQADVRFSQKIALDGRQ